MGLGGGANSSLHPPFRRKGGAPAPLHPPLVTGLREIEREIGRKRERYSRIKRTEKGWGEGQSMEMRLNKTVDIYLRL